MLIRVVKFNAEIHNHAGCINAPFYDYQDTVEIDTDELYHILLKNDEEILEHYISNK